MGLFFFFKPGRFSLPACNGTQAVLLKGEHLALILHQRFLRVSIGR